jgi:hypothetical protein
MGNMAWPDGKERQADSIGVGTESMGRLEQRGRQGESSRDLGSKRREGLTMAQVTNNELERYLRTTATYDNEFSKWQSRTKKLIKRYRDDTRGQTGNETAKFNILWSQRPDADPCRICQAPES